VAARANGMLQHSFLETLWEQPRPMIGDGKLPARMSLSSHFPIDSSYATEEERPW